jgi:aerobic carbon-monoxide dehydrogenase medium subunit
MQVPAHFEYERATSVRHALELLARWGPEARVVAGGHSLIPMMKLRLARPEALIDINDLVELSYVRLDGDGVSSGAGGRLRVGALTRHAELLASPVAGEHYPILHDAERVIADPIVRNRGTIGGSLCQADPSEDLSAAFAAIGATAVIQGPDGVREVPVHDFHVGPYETAVGAGELLIEVRVPVRPGGGSAYEKVERRVGDWPVAAAGAAVWLDGAAASVEAGGQTRTIADVGIGLTAVGARAFHAPEAEEFLRGRPATADTFAEAGRIAAEHCEPATDQRGPADYKRHLVAELTARALGRATSRAQGLAAVA